jgi:hypothetical protein
MELTRNYYELVGQLRARRLELGMSPDEVDRRAGLRRDSCARIERMEQPSLTLFHSRLMQPLLDALGVELVVVGDEPVARAPVRHQGGAHGLAEAA